MVTSNYATDRKPDAGRKRGKRPFEIDLALSRIRAAVEPFPKAALFELAADGFNTPFEQLAACIISIRTRDEVTVPTARRLVAAARTPGEMVRLSVAKIDRLIGTCSFHEPKARQLHAIARRVVDEFDGSCRATRTCFYRFMASGRNARTLCSASRAASPGSASTSMCTE